MGIVTLKDNEKKKLSGSVTVEMSFVLPMIIFIIFLLINTVFYYHDKAVLSGAVAETVEQGIEDIREDKNSSIDLESYLRARIGRKLVFLRPTGLSATKSEDKVKVRVEAEKGAFRTSVYLEGDVPYPEEKLREKKKAEDLLK